MKEVKNGKKRKTDTQRERKGRIKLAGDTFTFTPKDAQQRFRFKPKR